MTKLNTTIMSELHVDESILLSGLDKAKESLSHMDAIKKELGPVYGVRLIRDLPIGGGMIQAMPSRQDLEQVRAVSERTVAGYEMLLLHYLKLKEEHEKSTRKGD
jgi:hypothetical protein